MMLIPGPGSEQVGGEIAEILGAEAAVVEHRVFPDGENYIRLTAEVGGRDVVLVHSTAPPQDRRLVQLLLTLDAIREGGPRASPSCRLTWLTRVRTGGAFPGRP